jgi:hypothetical protein
MTQIEHFKMMLTSGGIQFSESPGKAYPDETRIKLGGYDTATFVFDSSGSLIDFEMERGG